MEVSICEVELRCLFVPTESKDRMNSALYEYICTEICRLGEGAQFVPMGMPVICWKTFPAKTTKMLSTRNSRHHDDVFVS